MILRPGILVAVFLHSLRVAGAEEVLVYAFVGDDVQLPCHTTATSGILQWYEGRVANEKDAGQKILSSFLPDGTPNIEDHDYGYNRSTKALIIEAVGLDKDGVFTCSVNNFQEGATYKHVQLNVYVLQGTPTLKGLDGAVTENVKVNIDCTVSVVKPYNVTFEWSYKNNGNVIVRYWTGRHMENDDKTFQVQNTLQKSFLRRDNGDSLRCRVKHGVKTTHITEVSRKITVQYKYKTTVVDRDPSVKPVLAGSKTLLCSEDEAGSPESSATLWFRDGRQLRDSGKYSGVNTRSLTFRKLQFGDESSYTCRVDNSAGEGRQGNPYRLDVLYAPRVTIAVPGGDSVHESTANFKIICTVSARPRSLSYIRLTVAGRQVEEKVNTEDHTLEHQIHEVDRQHKGTIVCEAKNEIDVGRASRNLTVFYGPVGRPKLTPCDEVVKVGETVTLTCDLSKVDLGHPQAETVVWYKGESEWPSGETKSISVDVQTIQDGGQFVCLVKNRIGSSGKSTPVNITAEVPVAMTPKTTIHDFTPLYSDTKFNVTYTVSGSNLEPVTWYNDTSPVKVRDFTLTNQTVQGDFSHGQTTAVEVGLSWNLSVNRLDSCSTLEYFNGNYYVKANGTAAGESVEVTKTFSITVQYPPFWKGHGDVMSSARNVRTVIVCQVCAHPEPEKYTWMFDKQQDLPAGASVDKNRVIIEKVNMKHFGNYTCTAENTAGKKSFSIILQQRGRPHKVTNFRVTERTSHTLRVAWTAGNDGGHPNMTFDLSHRPLGSRTWKYQKDISECPKEGDECRFPITGLTHNKTYELRVRPKTKKNGDPYGEYQKLNSTTRVEPWVSELEVEVTETALKVTWNYTKPARRRRDTDNTYKVYVTVSYQRAGEKKYFYPPEDAHKIPASNRTATIPGTFNPEAEYRVALKVYEASITNATYTTSYTAVSPYVAAAAGSLTSTVGIIVGILVVFILVLVIAFLIWRRRKEKHGKGRKTKTHPEDATVTNGLIDSANNPGGAKGPPLHGDAQPPGQIRPPVARPRTRKNKSSQNNSHLPTMEGSPGGSRSRKPQMSPHESPYMNTQLRHTELKPPENPYANVENYKAASTEGVYENVVVNDYQNVSLPVISTSSTDDNLYDEVAKDQQCHLSVGPDGTIYTDVCFSNGNDEPPQPESVQAADIHGVENRVEYAKIDFNKMREEQRRREQKRLEHDEGL